MRKNWGASLPQLKINKCTALLLDVRSPGLGMNASPSIMHLAILGSGVKKKQVKPPG
jgi:hypothetical protein